MPGSKRNHVTTIWSPMTGMVGEMLEQTDFSIDKENLKGFMKVLQRTQHE